MVVALGFFSACLSPEQPTRRDLYSSLSNTRSLYKIATHWDALRVVTTASRIVSCRLLQAKPKFPLQSPLRSSEAPDNESASEGRSMYEPAVSREALTSGQLCLCGVAILWGSYSPVVRYIYSCSGPPTPAALTAVRTVIQAAVLLASDLVLRQKQLGSLQKSKARRPSTPPILSTRLEALPSGVNKALNSLSYALQSSSSRLWIAGVELGFWNFCGSTFQAVGLQYTTATRGAFLIQVSNCMTGIHMMHLCRSFQQGLLQATSLLTPVMATLAGEQPGRGVWLGSCCTLIGTVLITLDHSAVSSHGTPAAASSLGMLSY